MSNTNQVSANSISLPPSVLISGASSGIGFATAVFLSKNGFFVYAGVRTEHDKEKLESMGDGKIQAVQLDVTKNDDISNVLDIIKSNQESALVALINSAGICKTSLISLCERDELLETFNVNVVSILALSNAMLPLLHQTKGKIINIESTSTRIPNMVTGGYCVSKAGLAMLGKVMRLEYGSKGVHVVTIQPGAVSTSFWKKIASEERKSPKKIIDSDSSQNDLFEKRQRHLHSLGESGTTSPEALASVIHRIIISTKPKFNYIVGKDALLRLYAYKFMPQRVFLYLTRKKWKKI